MRAKGVCIVHVSEVYVYLHAYASEVYVSYIGIHSEQEVVA
jgi:hypothetical protein